MPKAIILGVAGAALSQPERRLIAAARPAGLILFARNLETVEQIRRLVASFKAAAGSDRVLVLIDQEGGRVQRLKPPLASVLPPAAAYLAHFGGDLDAACRAARLVACIAARELMRFGINTNCAPVLDVPVPGAHGVIGNRAYGHRIEQVSALGAAVADGLMSQGVLPVMKHIPGHGRARADSHLELPVVAAPLAALKQTDFEPFARLKRLPAAMTAHVVFSAIDGESPASTSPVVTRDIIRGYCGFDGLLMSDDLGMKALSGGFGARTDAVLAAGSDIALHCSGNLGEMSAVAEAAPELGGRSLARFEAALAVTTQPEVSYDDVFARKLLDALVARGS